MKQIQTFLNETQYKAFRAEAERMGMSEYELTKNLILEFLEGKNKDIIKFKKMIREALKEAYVILDNAP